MTAPFVTLFTDASWCPRTRLGTWAAWAKTEGRPTIRRSNVLATRPASAGEAEILAIVSGLEAVRTAWPDPGMVVLIQSDSEEALGLLAGRRGIGNGSAPVVGGVHARIAELRRGGLARVYDRHVKGHRGTATPRNAVNTWCDAEAKRLLQAARVVFDKVNAGTTSSIPV
jgi:ribonuclease HI